MANELLRRRFLQLSGTNLPASLISFSEAPSALAAAAPLSDNDIADISKRIGLTPFDVGAAEDDIDHAPKWQEAIDRITANGGGAFLVPHIPAGWNLGDTISAYRRGQVTQKLAILGLGRQPIVNSLSTKRNIFEIGDGSNPVSDVIIENLQIVSRRRRVAGIDFSFLRHSNCALRNVKTEGSFSGINNEYANDFEIFRVEVNLPNPTNGYVIRHFSDPLVGRSDIIRITELTGQARNMGSDGMIVDGAIYGLDVDGFYALGVKCGLSVDSGHDAIHPTLGRFRKFEVDRSTTTAAVIEKAKDFSFMECDFANTSGAAAEPGGTGQGSNDTDVVTLGAEVCDLSFFGGRIGNGRKRGLVSSAKRLLIQKVHFHDLSKEGVGLHPMIYFTQQAGVTEVTSCSFRGEGRETYAIEAASGDVTGWVHRNNYAGLRKGFILTSNGLNVEKNITS